MNITSEPGGFSARLAALAGAVTLAGCIQGPWDYYPDNPPPFRGIFVTGYALAGKPVQHLCFERVLDLAEEATEAFPFYQSADVRIAGSFAGGADSLVLTPVVDTPNCFRGDSLALVQKDAAYALTARFTWDSAGTPVTSVLTATARVPKTFTLHRDAVAPSIAKTGGIPDSIFTPAFLASLPPTVLATLAAEYPDAVPLIAGNRSDTSSALRTYIAQHGRAIQARIVQLLGKEQYTYHEGDTLFYLNGAFNTLSHYFSADRSADVQSVLITQRFDSNSARPETRFDSPLGFKPDSSRYYFPGYIRRLILYQDAKGANGYDLLDSMGVVNVWFHTQRNRLYFYGFERAYYSYISTTVDNAGADPRIKPVYNITGGRGVFAGGIPDSFDVYIKTDALTKSYPLQVTHGLYCADKGWDDNTDCREYYSTYCSERDWKPLDCRQDAVSACLLADMNGDTALKARCAPSADTLTKDTALVARAQNQFCIEQDFPAGDTACAGAAVRCLETKGSNPCKQALWDYCLDHAWRPDQCGPGLASYCHDRPRLSETLCSHADAYCAAHAGSVLCK